MINHNPNTFDPTEVAEDEDIKTEEWRLVSLAIYMMRYMKENDKEIKNVVRIEPQKYINTP